LLTYTHARTFFVFSCNVSSCLLNHDRWQGCICRKRRRSCRCPREMSSSSPQPPQPLFECRWPHPSSDATSYLHFRWLCWPNLLRICFQLVRSYFCISKRNITTCLTLIFFYWAMLEIYKWEAFKKLYIYIYKILYY